MIGKRAYLSRIQTRIDKRTYLSTMQPMIGLKTTCVRGLAPFRIPSNTGFTQCSPRAGKYGALLLARLL